MTEEEKYEKRRAFAGERKPSMLRRCVGHDYTERRMYMVTMVTEGRRPLFGQVVGRSDGSAGSAEEPRMVLSPLGEAVAERWMATEKVYPEIEVVALQMMPDHLHGILFVKEKMERHLGMAIKGFKTGCNKAYRQLVLGRQEGDGLGFVATRSQQSQLAGDTGAEGTRAEAGTGGTQAEGEGKRDRRLDDREHGMLFALGYNDKVLLRAGQLETWLRYLKDNPRRLLMKRERPDLFRVQRGLTVGGLVFSALGNRFLLDRPLKVPVRCSRRLTEKEIEGEVARFLGMAKEGAVLVSPSISPGEKRVMRAAFDAGFPVVYLQENGLGELASPGGVRMDACSRGQLLILAPWEQHLDKRVISREQCLSLNDMARRVCEAEGGR